MKLLVLREGDETITIDQDGELRFANRPPGSSYDVEIVTLPEGQRCELVGGRGLVGDYAVVGVTCADLPTPAGPP